jgi:hypothetical protein
MFEQSIKVSLIGVSDDLPFAHHGLSIRWRYSSSMNTWDSCADWGDENRIHDVPVSDYLHQVIRGKEDYPGWGHIRLVWLVEVKLCNDTRIRVRVAYSVDHWTHPTLTLLRVSLVSVMWLTMTIRNRHTSTTLNYPYRHSLTNEPCSSRVSRSWEGEGEEWVRGLTVWYLYEIDLWIHGKTYSVMDLEID